MKPSVMIGIPIKNAQIFLPKFLTALDRLTYPNIKRIIFNYGISKDKTLDIIKTYVKKKRLKAKIEIYSEPSMNIPNIPVSGAFIADIYKDFQELITEDYFLLLDTDIADIPNDYIERLLSYNKSIIAPYVWVSRTPKIFYDTYIFRYKGCRFHPYYPPGLDRDIIEVDSVGTTYLVKRDIFLKGQYNNPHPHLNFCSSLRKQGIKIYATSQVEVWHEDLERLGIGHMPVEYYFNKPVQYIPFIDNSGRVRDANSFKFDIQFLNLIHQIASVSLNKYFILCFTTGKSLDWFYNYEYFTLLWMTRNKNLLSLLFNLVPYPSFIEIEHTTYCNIRCIMCEHTYWNEKPRMMDYNKFLEIVKQFPRLKWIGLTGIGESYLNKDFMKMIRYLKDRDVYIEIYDNFYNPTKEQLKELVELGVDRVFASIDAGTKETYEKIRKGSKWDVVWEKVVYFDRLIKQKGLTYPELCFHFIVTKHNVNEVLKYLKHIKNLNITPKIIRFARMLHKYKEVEDLFIEIPEETKHEILETAKELNLIIEWNADAIVDKPKYNTCTAWFMPFIFVDGTVIPCCALNEQNDREWQRLTSLGNIFNQSFKNIWYGRKYADLRNNIKDNKLCEACSRCPIYDLSEVKE